MNNQEITELRNLLDRIRQSQYVQNKFFNLCKQMENRLNNIEKRINREEAPDPNLYWKSNNGYILYSQMNDDHVRNAVAKQAAKGIVTPALMDEYLGRELHLEVKEEMITIQITTKKLGELLENGLVEGYSPPHRKDRRNVSRKLTF